MTYGGPTEFRYRGAFIPDYKIVPWDAGTMKWWYDNGPGLYDDIYMDLTWVETFERKGLDATAKDFALAFAHAGYDLWHANQTARHNILSGVMPPASGHWMHNPDADDIDFQIEADFAGLMSPGMPNTAVAIADTVGHIMNYGDGWYGGVYMAALYALAFTHNDIGYVVREALRTIPEQSAFHQTIRDVIRWHGEHPDDWKQTWFELQKKWADERGCPEGVYDAFDIDAKINAAYVVMGLLYGDGDFTRTIEVAMRAGQDSDCNPASAAGVLGAMLGYDAIPAHWKQGLPAVEDVDFKYTTLSLSEVYDLSYKHALQVVARGGGRVEEGFVELPVQTPQPVRYEESFAGHYPIGEVNFNTKVQDELTFTFEGIGFAATGWAGGGQGLDAVHTSELYVDGRLVETSRHPTAFRTRKNLPFWRYGLAPGKHTVRLRLVDPAPGAFLQVDRVIFYGEAPTKATF